MFINATGFYVPEERVDNQHFLELSGLTSEWIEQRTGIHTRSKAKEGENINTMSLEAVKDALPKLPYDITEVDLIVSLRILLMIRLRRPRIRFNMSILSLTRKLYIYPRLVLLS